MAFVKVKVDALEQQKKEYEKAIKSLDGALEQIKKVNASLGPCLRACALLLQS